MKVFNEGNKYSGTPPYDHPVNTATLLIWPLYSGLEKSSVSHILIKELLKYVTTLLIQPDFCGPFVTGLKAWFHCIIK